MAGINVTKKQLIWGAVAVIAVIVAGAAIWWFNQERLPGYNIEPIYRNEYLEPDGSVSQYFTGTVARNEFSILGPKVDVTSDYDGQTRTFYIKNETKIFVGIIFGEKSITGAERTTFDEVKPGYRVAVFVSKPNKAKRIHILRRPGGEE
jgi:hypothetical protein